MIDRHPVRIIVGDDLHRSRLTVFFRFLLAIPHLIWAALLGIAAIVVAFLNWFATLVRGQSPRALHDFLAGYVRYVTRIEAYLFLAANPFPGFFTGSSMDVYPIDLEIDPPQPQNRWKTGFRLLLAIPAFLVDAALSGALVASAVLTWFYALVKGSAPWGLRNLSAYALRYDAQTISYVYLVTDAYPHASPLEGEEPLAE